VILNLLLNATQAMPDGGDIEVEVYPVGPHADGGATLCVRDHGIGIKEEHQEKLFTPFFTTKEDGTGLGLVTSRKIVEAHGGQIRVTSKPGEGTSFFIDLPS
jgi:signal transduction histidine kinase